MEKNRNQVEKFELPLPGEGNKPTREIPQDSDLNQYFRKKMPAWADSTGSTDFHRGSRSGGRGRALIAWSFMAAFIDSLVLGSLACSFLFTFSLLMKVQAISVVHLMASEIVQVGVMGCVFLASMYMIMLRVFLGFTIGEWACGLRLGTLKQRLNRLYSLRVIARTLLVIATGFWLLPALSMLFGRDLQGLIVRLPLIRMGP